MSLRTLVRGLAFIGAAALLATLVPVSSGAQDDAQKGEGMEGMPAPPKPGPEHACFLKAAGTWKATLKMWMAPGTDPMMMEGQEVAQTICGGMGVTTSFTGSSPMGDMTGHGTESYDVYQKKYIGYWVDNWGAVSLYEGTADDKGVITYTANGPDPMTGAMSTSMMRHEWLDANTRRFTMWHGTDTSAPPSMEITYVRS